jgi:hypothetical protein
MQLIMDKHIYDINASLFIPFWGTYLTPLWCSSPSENLDPSCQMGQWRRRCCVFLRGVVLRDLALGWRLSLMHTPWIELADHGHVDNFTSWVPSAARFVCCSGPLVRVSCRMRALDKYRLIWLQTYIAHARCCGYAN